MTTAQFLEQIDNISVESILSEQFISQERLDKESLSKRDITSLSNKIAHFKDSPVDTTLKCILYLAIWEPDLAIEISRKKGVFRYKAWPLDRNHALYIVTTIKNSSNRFSFSKQTIGYLNSKFHISWLFDFYKESESAIISTIKMHYKNRHRATHWGVACEESLLKELLVFADLLFTQPRWPDNSSRKDKITDYTLEEIAEGISYVLYLTTTAIHHPNYIQPIVDPKYVLSDDIKSLILLGCRVCALQEWELCIDYFSYSVTNQDRVFTISPPDDIFEKSIRLGYVKSMMQNQLIHERNAKHFQEALSLSEITNMINHYERLHCITEVGSGITSRYRFEIPEPILAKFFEHTDKFFKEEIIDLNHFSNELAMPIEDLLEKRITDNCSMHDVVLFNRFFLILDLIAEKQILSQKNKQKVISSLLPNFSEDDLVAIIGKYIGDTKARELINLFTYNPKFKLDLQYTPFFKLGNSISVPIDLIAKSNLSRNCIAYSYLQKNQIVNQDDKEHLVLECEKLFKVNHPEYRIFTNKHFRYQKQTGEIDVLVITDNNILIIECKAPLEPANNFELRSSYDHIQKAAKQLSHSKHAFSDAQFRKNYLRAIGIDEKPRNIHTCIIMGNRLFNGLSVMSHPVRYVHELDMILNNGKIHSSVGDWRVWKTKDFSEDDLLDFLSLNNNLITASFNAMKPFSRSMHVKGKRIEFSSFVLNFLDVIDNYDQCFLIESRNEDALAQIKEYTTQKP